MKLIERLKVNERYKATLAPLGRKELEQLRDNILSEEGFLSPVLYHLSESGDEVIVDGHHRYQIWLNDGDMHTLECPPTREVVELSGADEEAVIKWIRKHQRGRRNDPSLAEQYELGKEVIEARGKGITSAEFVAEDELTPSQARHAAQLADKIDEAEEASPGFRDQILGDESMSAEAAKKAAKVVTKPGAEPLMAFEALQKSLKSLSRSTQLVIDAFPDVGDSSDFQGKINVLFAALKEWEDKCIEFSDAEEN
jgi:hypothetical protein